MLADRLRARFEESRIIIGAAVTVGFVSGACALQGGRVAGALVAATIGLCGSIARLAFDSIVQRDQPVVGQGAAFARFETRFQLSWVLGALVATGVEPPRSVGMLLISAAMTGACVVGFVGEPALEWLVERQQAVRRGFRRGAPGGTAHSAHRIADARGPEPAPTVPGRRDGHDGSRRVVAKSTVSGATTSAATSAATSTATSTVDPAAPEVSFPPRSAYRLPVTATRPREKRGRR